jgi:hypothetical protein
VTPEKQRKIRRFLELAEKYLTRLAAEGYYGSGSFEWSMQDGQLNNATKGVKQIMPLAVKEHDG